MDKGGTPCPLPLPSPSPSSSTSKPANRFRLPAESRAPMDLACIPNGGVHYFRLLQNLDGRRGLVGTPGTNGAGIDRVTHLESRFWLHLKKREVVCYNLWLASQSVPAFLRCCAV